MPKANNSLAYESCVVRAHSIKSCDEKLAYLQDCPLEYVSRSIRLYILLRIKIATIFRPTLIFKQICVAVMLRCIVTIIINS